MTGPSLLAKITTKPGSRADAVAVFQQMLDHVETEDGTLMYVLHEDVNDDEVLWFYERYTDDAALAAHSGSEMMKTVGRALGDLLAGRPELIHLATVGGKGL